MLRDLFEGLTRLDHHAAPIAGAAESWSVSADGRVYTFKLRAGLRWSNGDALVAGDYVAGLRRLVDPATASQYAEVVDVIVNASEIVAGKQPVDSLGVAAPDDATVIVTLANPAPYLPGLMAHPSCSPLHRPSLALLGERFSRPGAQVSNGAFVLAEWLQGSFIRAGRNRNYWNNAANRIDAVKYLQIADENAELRAYRAGEAHITVVVPRGQFDWIREKSARRAARSAADEHLLLRFQPGSTEVSRSATAPRLVDGHRSRTPRQLSAARGRVAAYGWVPPGIFNYQSQSFDYAGAPMPERIAEARKLLAAAGFSAEKPLSFELRYNTGEVHTKVAVAVSSMWKEALGVDVNLAGVEFKSLMQDIDRRDIDLYRISWVGDYNDCLHLPAIPEGRLRHQSAALCEPRIRRAARRRGTTGRRAPAPRIARKAERTALADHPLIPLYFYVNKHLVKPEVRGWYDNVMNVYYSQELDLMATQPPG